MVEVRFTGLTQTKYGTKSRGETLKLPKEDAIKLSRLHTVEIAETEKLKAVDVIAVATEYIAKNTDKDVVIDGVGLKLKQDGSLTKQSIEKLNILIEEA